MLPPLEEPRFGLASLAGYWKSSPNDLPPLCENCTLCASDNQVRLFGRKIAPGVSNNVGGRQSASFRIDNFLQSCVWTTGSLQEIIPLDGSEKPMLLFACEEGVSRSYVRPHVQCVSRSYEAIAWKLKVAQDHDVFMKLSLDEGGKSATLQTEDSGRTTYHHMVRSALKEARPGSSLATLELHDTVAYEEQRQRTPKPCARDGCPFLATWHPTHCCFACEGNGNHGNYCERSVKDGCGMCSPSEASAHQSKPPLLFSGNGGLPTAPLLLFGRESLAKKKKPYLQVENTLSCVREVATVRASKFGCFGFRARRT